MDSGPELSFSESATINEPTSTPAPTPTPTNTRPTHGHHSSTIAIAAVIQILIIIISIIACLVFRRRARQNQAATSPLPELDGRQKTPELDGNQKPLPPWPASIELPALPRPAAELQGITPVGPPAVVPPSPEISPTPPPWVSPVPEGLPENITHPTPQIASPTPPVAPPTAPEDDEEIQLLQRERVRVSERRERLLMLQALDDEDRRLEERISERMSGLRGGV